MLLFFNLLLKLFASKSSAASKESSESYFQAFILEPILTPSAFIDNPNDGQDIPDIDTVDIEEFALVEVGKAIAPLPDGFTETDWVIDEFDTGIFTVGETGDVGVEFLFDGGKYQGELAIFSLQGMEDLEPGSEDFIAEAARRAFSDTEEGHIVISDKTEGALFSGSLGEDKNWNGGEYQGEKSFKMRSGDSFGVMLVPNGTVENVIDNPNIGGSKTPLFSLATANPEDGLHLGQIADVDGEGNTFVMEDWRSDRGTDGDYNDFIFRITGATGEAPEMEDLIEPDLDWRETELGQDIVDYITPDEPISQPKIEEFPPENQPLIGVIDTGFSSNNPDLNYDNITLGSDFIDGDTNPFIDAGEGSEHGTHILGTIGATQDNNIGIDGINDDAPLWVGRAVGSGKWADSLTEFVDAAKESGQPNAVVNLSLDLTQIDADGNVTTRYELTHIEREALEYARQNDVLVVVAAGNDNDVMSALGQASQEFDNVITVGSADGLERAEYSNYGKGLDILAEGGTTEKGVVSLVEDNVGILSGTSIATAKVTGAASQVWAANPELNYRQVIDILKNTATDLDTPGWDEETGMGLLNTNAAVNAAKSTTPEQYEPEELLIPNTWGGEGIVEPNERAVAEQWTNGKYYDWESYRIQSGDTLGAIAKRTLGSSAYNAYMWIANRNGIANPNHIVTGHWIQIPKEVDPPPTYQVTGDFYDKWIALNGANGILRQPTSNRYFTLRGERQNFQGGAILKSEVGVFPLFGGIGAHYLNNEGGERGRLGFPTSQEIGVGNGVIHQHFENGYIRYGDGPTRTIIQSPIDKQSVINNGGWWADYYQGDFRYHYGSEQLPQQTPWGKLGKSWGHGGPVGLKDDFSMRLSAKRYLEPGKYLIKVSADDRSRVRIDGKEIISAWFNGSFGQQAYFESQGGYHDIELDYKEDFLSAGISLDWIPQFLSVNGFRVDGEFFEVYHPHKTGLGNPISNVEIDANGNSIQKFENGKIVKNQYGIFPIYGKMGEEYQQEGGENGKLGQPTSAPVDLGNGFLKQTFEGGYIIWNGQKAIAYFLGKGTPTLPKPKPEPLALSKVGFDGSSVHQTYVKTYQRNGGHSVLGFPINNVHPWEGGHTQDFDWGSDGRGAIMKSNVNDRSYWVGGKIWEKFLELGGARTTGYPKTDAISIKGGLDKGGGFVQHFRGGRDGDPSKMWLSKNGAHPTWGAIGGRYDQLGGPRSFLGFPTDKERGIGNGWIIQHYEGGYITWHPQHGTTVYDKKAIDSLPPDSGNGSTEEWTVKFWNNKNLSGPPHTTLTQPAGELRFHAGSGAPVGTLGIKEDNFSARWETTSHFEGGFYNFITKADDGMKVYINGVLVNSKWAAANPWERHDAYVAIPEGKHHIRIDYFEQGGNAAISSLWEPSGLLKGWKGDFRPVGYDGSSVHGTYVRTYQRNGAIPKLGYPLNNVHPWEDGYIQDFEGGSEGRGGIMKSNVNDNSYWVGGKIWEKFLELGGARTTGYPKTDLIPIQGGLDKSGGHVQHFRGGRDGIPTKIWLSKHGAHPTWGAIGAKYEQLGGAASWLGFPTSKEQGIGGGWVKQDFEGGYMLWHPSHGAIAYDTQSLSHIPETGNSSTSNWHAQYWNNKWLVGSPQWSKYEEMSDLRFHAGHGAPQGTRGIKEDEFGGRWITTSYFDGGIYNFINKADDGVRVYVDGELVIDKWRDSGFEQKQAFAAIEPGYHQVMVEYFENKGNAANWLRWENVNTPQAWSGEVFNNTSLAGRPKGYVNKDNEFLNEIWGAGGIPDLLTPNDRWRLMPGKAKDISVGADGSIWAIGATPSGGSGDYSIHQWTGKDWKRVNGGAQQIAVSPDGTPWVVNTWGNIYQRNGNKWQIMPGQAKDISIGADGSVWAIAENPVSGGYGIQRWDGQGWQEVGGGAVRITVAPDGTPWVVNASGFIYKRVGNSWQNIPGRAKDIEIGADGSVWIIGSDRVSGGHSIQRWNGQGWQKVNGGATRITVGPDGKPWVVNSNDNIYARERYVGGSDVTNRDRFSDRWTTTRYFDEPGVYEFISQSDDGIRVWVDDKLVIDHWNIHGLATDKVLVPLDKGHHRIRVEHFENTGLAANKLTWKKVAGQPNYIYGSGWNWGNSGSSGWLEPWTAEYFNNSNLQGAPTVTRLENNHIFGLTGGFNLDWKNGSPDSRIRADHFSSRLTSHRYLPGGTYKFKLQGDDGMRLFINGENIVDRWKNPPFAPHEVEVELPEGIHTFQVEHSEAGGLAYANLNWDRVSNTVQHSILPQFQAAHAQLESQLGKGAVGVPITDLKQEYHWPTPPPGLFAPTMMFPVSQPYQEFRGTQGRGALFQANNGNGAYYIFGKLWEAYQKAGGAKVLGKPIASQKDLGNGAYELELPNGRLFWVPGMTNPTYYEYAKGTPKTLTIPADAWRGEYFDNPNWSGDPLVVRQDSISGAGLEERWGHDSPAPGLPQDNFSVRWTSNRPFDRGTYRFKGEHDDGFTVEVNGQKPINKMIEVATRTTGYGTFAYGGQYPIEVKHREYSRSAMAKLDYEKASSYVLGLDKHNKSHQAIIDAFNRHGGYAKVGVPMNDVHGWSSHGIIQDFNNGPNGAGIVMQRHGSNTAYYISGKIRQAFLDKGGPGKFGYPLGDARNIGNGITYQPFQHGYIQIMPNGQVRAHTYNYKEFVGWAMPGIGTAHRHSPNLHHRTGGATAYKHWLNFDAWTYGDTATDTQLGTPDSRWFRIKGTNTWVPSAYIFGNPEGLPGGGGSGNGNGNGNNGGIRLIRTGGGSLRDQWVSLQDSVKKYTKEVDELQAEIDKKNAEIAKHPVWMRDSLRQLYKMDELESKYENSKSLLNNAKQNRNTFQQQYQHYINLESKADDWWWWEDQANDVDSLNNRNSDVGKLFSDLSDSLFEHYEKATGAYISDAYQANVSGNSWHGGLDFGAWTGKSVNSLVDGTVVNSSSHYGLLTIKGLDGKYYIYKHLQTRTYEDGTSVKVGDTVQAGMKVGTVGGIGANGYTQFDPHLHYEVSTVGGYGAASIQGVLSSKQRIREVNFNPLKNYWERLWYGV